MWLAKYGVFSCTHREREARRQEAAQREARIDEQQQALRQKGAVLRSLEATLPFTFPASAHPSITCPLHAWEGWRQQHVLKRAVLRSLEASLSPQDRL